MTVARHQFLKNCTRRVGLSYNLDLITWSLCNIHINDFKTLSKYFSLIFICIVFIFFFIQDDTFLHMQISHSLFTSLHGMQFYFNLKSNDSSFNLVTFSRPDGWWILLELHQLNCEGWRISFALGNINQPFGYLLGIKCKGNTEHHENDKCRVKKQEWKRLKHVQNMFESNSLIHISLV